MGIFERYLSVWVGLSIVVGVLLGQINPETFTLLAQLEIAHVNVVIAVLIWLMIFAFAPITALLLGVNDIQVPLNTLLI